MEKISKRTQNRVDEEWEIIQKKFVEDLKDRMDYLEKYISSKYSPLKAKCEIVNDEEAPFIHLVFTLVGENGWSIKKAIHIGKLDIGQSKYRSDIADRYYQEIREDFDYEIVKEGIRSINTRKV